MQQKVQCMQLARQGFASGVAYFFNRLKKKNKATKCWLVQKEVAASGKIKIRKDNLNDLLDVDTHDLRYTRQQFLADAMHRFEEGAFCYSWAEEGRLLGCVWITNEKMPMGEPVKDETTTRSVFSLSVLYCHRKERDQFSVFLQSVASELAVDHPHDKLYIITNCNEDLLFEKAGFRPSK